MQEVRKFQIFLAVPLTGPEKSGLISFKFHDIE
jgi:hypothetical protein